MNYAFEMGSGALILHAKFHKDCFSHLKVIKGDTYTHRQQNYLISLLLLFQIKESRLKNLECTTVLTVTFKDTHHTASGPEPFPSKTHSATCISLQGHIVLGLQIGPCLER
jgi:hypothetical protein